MEPVVITEELEQEPGLLAKQFSRSFLPLALEEEFRRANAVVIKPNLTYPRYKEGVTTRKEFVEGLVVALRQINSTTKIYIGEGEGGYNTFSMTEAMRAMGYFDLERSYPNLKIINFSQQPSREVEFDTPFGNYALRLPQIFFDEVDFSISCPLPKVHCMTKLSLSYKNQWGCIPDAMRLKNHYRFGSIIPKISEILKFRYAFLDGRYGLDNNGPMVGTPVEVNWFVASNSLGAFDRVLSDLMGFYYRKIAHLKTAESYGLIPDQRKIELIGDPGKLKRKFTLKRNFWNYPALAAFHSKHLTHLFYFSRCAKLLHDIMYTFRERPISS
jgi:uncharacterized protein (DUF362 family)